jgi:hypothetical protein
MNKSTTIGELAKALICFHVKVDSIKKDAKNPFFKSTYASLPNILEAINEPLNESGLALTMFPYGEHGLWCLLIHAESGEFIECVYLMKPVRDTPQDKGGCLSYQRRYCISSILNLQIDDLMLDDDGNKASGNVNTKEEVKDNREWLNKGSESFTKALAYMQTGGDITIIEKKYKLSKEVKSLLLK